MAVAERTRMFDTKIGIDEPERRELIALLNRQMAANLDLYTQAKQAHWNVKGMDFFQLHELFDQLAAAVEPFTDDLAERATALGGVARGTVRMAAGATELAEFPDDAVGGREHLEVVRDRFAAYAASTRAAIEASADLGDAATEDLFTEIQRVVDEKLYFLESHLQG